MADVLRLDAFFARTPAFVGFVVLVVAVQAGPMAVVFAGQDMQIFEPVSFGLELASGN
jgi:hypothetical protein